MPIGLRHQRHTEQQRGVAQQVILFVGQAKVTAAKPGKKAPDRVHQSMVLSAPSRGEALRRFLVDEGIGRDESFWRLAHALSALYPMGTDEKRWVDGVPACKKGLGS